MFCLTTEKNLKLKSPYVYIHNLAQMSISLEYLMKFASISILETGILANKNGILFMMVIPWLTDDGDHMPQYNIASAVGYCYWVVYQFKI